MARVLSDLVQHLGRLAARNGLTQLADGEFLRRFAADRDSLAFEALVWRHGAMVLGVCGRVLGRGGDADDAFQATFLALVRHARAVRAGGSLAGWLYRVARRVSARACRQRLRRAGRERLAARPEAVAGDEAERSEWRAAGPRGGAAARPVPRGVRPLPPGGPGARGRRARTRLAARDAQLAAGAGQGAA